MAKFPHCDERVLHAPAICSICDAYPKLQADRIAKRINFTGENDPYKAPCPADKDRGLGQAHKWYGNAPKPIGCTCTMFQIENLSTCPIHDK